MTYCKLIEGRLVYAPKKITYNNTTVYNPTGEQLAEQGWKPLVIEEMPEPREGYHFEPEYTETAESIIESWVEVEDIPDAEELLEIILGGDGE